MGINFSYALSLFIEFAVAKTYAGRLFLPVRKNIIVTGAFVIGYLLLYITHIAFLSPFINLIMFFLVNFLLFFTCFQVDCHKAIIQSIMFTTANVLTDITALVTFIGLSSITNVNFNDFFVNSTMNFSVSLISKLFYTIAVFIYMCSNYIYIDKHSEHFNSFDSSLKLFYPIFLLPFSSIIIALWLCYFGMSHSITPELEKFMKIIILVLWIINALFIILYAKSLRVKENNAEIQLALIREKFYTSYYKNMVVQSQNQNIIIHDIKNHLLALSALAKNNDNTDMIDYINSMEKQLNESAVKHFSDNDILDCILFFKKQECISKNINLTCDIRTGCLLNMDNSDIVALFSNLLSNAIEAAAQSEKKYINVTVKNHENSGVNIISVINACDIPPTSDGNNSYISTKKSDDNIHGIGLLSIKRVIHNYNGVFTMYFDNTNNEFRTIIQIPYFK